MSIKQWFQTACLGLCGMVGSAAGAEAPAPFGPTPTEQQVKWLRMEWYAFVHFGLNTYTNKEWGYGDESPGMFNPGDFDAEAIVTTFKKAGMQGMIYTAKHHDGFCTWPTKSTTHNITLSPWKNGKGDVVKEFATACQRHNFPFGTYLSPWDRNCAEYGRAGYLDVYYKQIEELLTNYGPIFEIWFDGAMGGDGFYGGARENRNIGKADNYYNYTQVVKNIRKLQPDCIIWGAAERGDVTWAGSEKGFAKDYPLWNIRGQKWLSWEADTPINHRGWFWHPGQASAVKTPQHLMEVYLASVGRGANLILNVAPNRDGRLDPADVASLQAFGDMRTKLLATDYALKATVTASESRGEKFNGAQLTDGDIESYWCPKDGTTTPTAEIKLAAPATFDVVRLREQIRLGQRVSSFKVEAWVDGAWKTIVEPGKPGERETRFDGIRGGKGHTIGNQVLRWLPAPVTTDRVRLSITSAKACPCISEFSLLRMPSAEATAPVEPVSDPTVLSSKGWKFRGFASNLAPLAFDGNKDTMWQHAKTPSHFVVDMTKEHRLTGFSYLPRQDGKTQGMTTRYRVELSSDCKNWKTVAEGEFGNLRANPVEQHVSFPPQKARYVRFFSTAALDGSGSSVAELKLHH